MQEGFLDQVAVLEVGAQLRQQVLAVSAGVFGKFQLRRRSLKKHHVTVFQLYPVDKCDR